MRERPGLALPALMFLVVACGGSGTAPDPVSEPQTPVETFTLQLGANEFTFVDSLGNVTRPIRVRYHMPTGYTPSSPIVFVMHGASRGAQSYFNAWLQPAMDHGFLLVVPEFDDINYPGSRWYNLGNVFPGEEPTTQNPDSTWTFTAIEHLFDVIRMAAGSSRTTFRIYGHSAGSQFVHRFLMVRPTAPIERVVAANAGWYTLPTDSIRWPYGLGDAGIDPSSLAGRYELDVTVLLGDQDTDPNASNLRRTPEAQDQGPHRFARGHTFHAVARSSAEALGVPFAWVLDTVPDAGHSNSQMAPRAAEILARQ